jgi:hypothetical protein
MRRLHTAALAAFLLCVGGGAAHAYYYSICVATGITGNIAVLNTGKTFNPGVQFACGGGQTSCCFYLISDVQVSGDGGSTWHPYTHHETTQQSYGCGTSNDVLNDSIGVTSGLYRCTTTMNACGGVAGPIASGRSGTAPSTISAPTRTHSPDPEAACAGDCSRRSRS